VAVLLAGAAGCLLLRRYTAATVTGPPATGSPRAATSPLAEMAGSAAGITSPPGEVTSSPAGVVSPAAAPVGSAAPAPPLLLPGRTRQEPGPGAHRPADQKGSLP
jgi:hypothetical protein